MPPRPAAATAALRILARPHTTAAASCLLPPTYLAPLRHLQRSHQQRNASILSSLSDNPGAYQKRIRKGRGPASGKGKTAGRGQKGQHAHGKVPRGFQGGQTPLSITKPERGRGVYNPFKVEMSPINLDRIQSWIDQGRLNPDEPITMKELKKSRCIHGVKRHGVKLLGRDADKLTSKINIIVSRASASAIARIESLGGTVTTRFYSPTSIKRVLKGDTHPTISLLSSPHFLARAADSSILSALPDSSLAATLSSDSAPVEAKAQAMRAVFDAVRSKYKYRLADATARKDIEYYRDPAHRGYLVHTVKEGESPSLFFKEKVEIRDAKKMQARKDSARSSAENRLF